MKTVKVKFKKLWDDAQLPTKAHPSDAGMDLYANTFTVLGYGGEIANTRSARVKWLKPGERTLIKCGFAMALPEGWEAQIRARSGLALKKGISVVNAPGTIDSAWRGELAVILINHSDEDVKIEKGSRIAQMVISEVPQIEVEEVDELDETDRGENGFGSSGN